MAHDRNIPLNPAAARKLADAITRRRIELGIRSARMLGTEAGLDYRTITSIEACRRDNVSRNTLGVLEMHLQWPIGYLNALLNAADAATDGTTITLNVPGGATSADVDRAREIAQATFNATLNQMSGNV